MAIRQSIELSVVVWGGYIETMQYNLLPSLLAPNNLPALVRMHDATLTIAAPAGEAQRLRMQPICERVRALLPVRFSSIPLTHPQGPHGLLAETQMGLLADAALNGVGCVMLAPDIVLADGALRTVGDEAARGTNALLVAGIRADIRTAWHALERFRHDGVLALAPRQLMRLLLEHLHPVTRSLIINGPQASRWPSHMYWHIGDEGLLARCFHLHPLYVRPTTAATEDTIDGDYVEKTYPDGKGVRIITHTDDLALIELSETSHMAGTVYDRPPEQEGIAHWIDVIPSAFQKQHAQRSIRVVAAETLDERRWDATEKEATLFLREVGLYG